MSVKLLPEEINYVELTTYVKLYKMLNMPISQVERIVEGRVRDISMLRNRLCGKGWSKYQQMPQDKAVA